MESKHFSFYLSQLQSKVNLPIEDDDYILPQWELFYSWANFGSTILMSYTSYCPITDSLIVVLRIEKFLGPYQNAKSVGKRKENKIFYRARTQSPILSPIKFHHIVCHSHEPLPIFGIYIFFISASLLWLPQHFVQ